jgi:tetratricopeptide (TPR) repeat protein
MRQEEALDAYTEALNIDPTQFRVELSRGHVLKTLGRRAAAEAAYRRCLELKPEYGEAYYSFADLKNYHFSDPELAAMQETLQRTPIADKSRAQVHFAIGRALEQREKYPEAFHHYASGNSMRRRDAPFDRPPSNKSAVAWPPHSAGSFCDRTTGAEATSPRPFLWSACRAPDPPWWNKYWPVTRASKEPWNCPMCCEWCASSIKPQGRMITQKACLD